MSDLRLVRADRQPVIVTEYLKFLAVWLRTRIESDPERSSVVHLISGGAPSRQAIAEPALR